MSKQVPDGVYDNRETSRRERWSDGELLSFLMKQDVVENTPEEAFKWGFFPDLPGDSGGAKISFSDSHFLDVSTCPNCGGCYLHHDKVEVFERAEDAEDGTHAVVDGHMVKVDRNISLNPSRRRGGLLVHFRCEDCSARPVLSIVQHKGNTYLGWQKGGNDECKE